MLSPLIRRSRTKISHRSQERGFTMALVAVALVAIIAMAALSIDIGTLYEAKSEAQRSADAAALTAARVISISGITGDPANSSASWALICGGSGSMASLAATKIAQQNLIGGVAVAPGAVTVNYGAGRAGGANPDCSGLGPDFGVNPLVTVTVRRTNLPTFFARVFSLFGSNASNTVSATASAEAFNPSNSGNVAASGTIPVNPRCVKPWIIPNVNPAPGLGGAPFVNLADGSIVSGGVRALTPTAVIGEEINIDTDCALGKPDCLPSPPAPPPVPGDMVANPPTVPPAPPGTIRYLPALVLANAGAAPACSAANDFQKSIVGCDQNTAYACGISGGAQIDLNENPVNPDGLTGDTGTAAQCLIHAPGGQDVLVPGVFPFQIQAGFNNPLVSKGIVNNDDLITTSNSIVTIPIYDSTSIAPLVPPQPSVTIVGFLQVFIKDVTATGLDVYILNVAGCSNVAANPAVSGTSPVPVRLVTPP